MNILGVADSTANGKVPDPLSVDEVWHVRLAGGGGTQLVPRTYPSIIPRFSTNFQSALPGHG